ncbi:hypothetical protein EOI87_09825 [Salmonella enterica]|nr:hypothetical protein [Salmonella enterica]MIV18185.1 hypothetical protein [Salmonella enterica]
MNLKLKLIQVVGTSSFCPRRIKMFLLWRVMRQVEWEINRTLAEADVSKIPPDQRDELNALINRMNIACGRSRYDE